MEPGSSVVDCGRTRDRRCKMTCERFRPDIMRSVFPVKTAKEEGILPRNVRQSPSLEIFMVQPDEARSDPTASPALSRGLDYRPPVVPSSLNVSIVLPRSGMQGGSIHLA